MEDTFVFYGYYGNKTITYKSDDGEDKEFTYFMGLAFSVITLISLFISSITMLFNLGKTTRKRIVQSLDSMKSIAFCNKIFCSWDYRVKVKHKRNNGNFFIKYTKASYLRHLNRELTDIQYKANLKNQKWSDRLWLLTKRSLVFIFIPALFGLAFYGFYKLNQRSVKAKNNTNDRYYKLFLEYVPAIMLKVINLVFREIFQRLNYFEKYKQNTSLTWLLVRTGVARISVLLFLIVTVSSNILQNNDLCAKQSNDILQEFNPTDEFFNKKRENIYVIYILRKKRRFYLFHHSYDLIFFKCWENYVGSEFYKLVVIDFVLQIPFLLYELTAYLLYKRFKIEFFNFSFDLTNRFLNLLYIQTVFWLAIYFSPFIGVFGFIFYFVKFYTDLVSLKKLTSFSKANEIDEKLNSSFVLILFAVFLIVLILVGIVFTL